MFTNLMVTIAKTASMHHFTHETFSAYKQQIYEAPFLVDSLGICSKKYYQRHKNICLSGRSQSYPWNLPLFYTGLKHTLILNISGTPPTFVKQLIYYVQIINDINFEGSRYEIWCCCNTFTVPTNSHHLYITDITELAHFLWKKRRKIFKIQYFLRILQALEVYSLSKEQLQKR